MSYFCEYCGEYLGGYGHLYSPCSYKLLPSLLADELKNEHGLPWSAGIVQTAVREARERLVKASQPAHWLDNGDAIKAQALKELRWELIKSIFMYAAVTVGGVLLYGWVTQL